MTGTREKKSDKMQICPICGKWGFRTWRWAKSRLYKYLYIGHGSGGDKHGKGNTRTWCYIGKLI